MHFLFFNYIQTFVSYHWRWIQIVLKSLIWCFSISIVLIFLSIYRYIYIERERDKREREGDTNCVCLSLVRVLWNTIALSNRAAQVAWIVSTYTVTNADDVPFTRLPQFRVSKLIEKHLKNIYTLCNELKPHFMNKHLLYITVILFYLIPYIYWHSTVNHFHV